MKGFSKRILLYNFLIWSVVAIFTATQLYLKSVHSGQVSSWWALFKIQLWVWWIWGAMTPFVFWLGSRFRLDRLPVWKIVAVHLPISILLVCFYLAVYSIIWNLDQQGTINIGTFWQLFTILFTNLFHWHFFIYMAIIGVVHAQAYYAESRSLAIRGIRLEKQLLQSQLNFLKAQLQPHFLFNTLNGIVSSIHQGKAKTAANMVTELSELLRISLSGTERQIISLEEELKYVKSYLNIEKFRFKDLEVLYDVPEELMHAEIPHFMLQPIVENAVKHGIARKTSARKIRLSARKTEHSLYFEVENEGPPVEQMEFGIGLTNTHRRLQALFGAEGQMTIQPNSAGTTVKIKIPAHENI